MNESAISQYRHSVRASLTMGLHYSLAACLLAAFSIGLAQAQQPDYNMLDEILARNVRNGFVDYDGIAAEQQLSKVIEQFGDKQSADISSFNSKLAFYINAYNTLAIQGILDGQSPSSWWGRRKFFNQQQFKVLGETINLHELEHEHIITLSEPRIHFAIVCASISCPRLSSRAYRANTLDLQLHEAAVKFIKSNKDKPFLAYIAHNQPHLGLFASDAFTGKSRRGLLGDVMSEIDDSVGQVLATLRQEGIDKNTLIIFSSDNGPWLRFKKKDSRRRLDVGYAYPFRDGKGCASWEGGFRVPGIFYWPGVIESKRQLQPASTLDILPTLLRSLIDTNPRSKKKVSDA